MSAWEAVLQPHSFLIDINHMGLDLLPRSLSPHTPEWPNGMTHLVSESCPFKEDNNPVGVLSTCCSFRGSTVVWYLLALALFPPMMDIYRDKTSVGAIEFAKDLRELVAEFRLHFTETAAKKAR